MKKMLVFLALSVLIVGGGGMFCSDEADDGKAYVRFDNDTGYTLANIEGAGATWTGPYSDGETTEAKEVATGNHEVTWDCDGTSYNRFVDIDKGSWLIRMNDCAATDPDVIEE